MASLSGKQLHIRERNPHFRNKSQLLLPLGEEIVHSPEKLDLLSSSIKGKRIRPKKVRIPNLKRAVAFNSRSTREKLTLPSEGRRVTPVVFVFVLQVDVILLSIGECRDDSLALKTQETTIGVVCEKRRARSHSGGMQELRYIRSQATLRSIKPRLFPNIPPDRRNPVSRLAIPRI